MFSPLECFLSFQITDFKALFPPFFFLLPASLSPPLLSLSFPECLFKIEQCICSHCIICSVINLRLQVYSELEIQV